MFLTFHTFILLIVFKETTFAQSSQNDDLEIVFDKMEADVLELRDEVERVYKDLRCSIETLQECFEGNYDDCNSEYPNPTCPSKEISYAQINACNAKKSGNSACGSGLFDYTVPSFSIPNSLTNGLVVPKDKKVVETICYSKQLDPWFVNKHKEDNDYWGDAGVEDPSFFFGSQDGVFRIFPARHSQVCGQYDPRLRPWYNAASSGPKNVIMVLDTSGSMQGRRLELLKKAAERVINSLSIGDRVAVVQFSTDAKLFAGDNGRMLTATANNKQYLRSMINGFEAIGGTNFYDAFESAFRVLDATIEVELAADCNSVILFLTDGEMTGPQRIPEEDRPARVIDLVTQRTLQVNSDHPILLFTYSINEDESNVHSFPKKLACSVKSGVWSQIVDETKLVESFASYSLLFALGLGVGKNEAFVAWSEPYEYSTGGVIGTTVSAPVYDRTLEVPIFIGVVGFDVTINAIERVGNAGAKEVLKRVVNTSTAKCPTLETTSCVLESFRRQGSAGDNALCLPDNCTDSVQIDPKICSLLSDLPSNVIHNTKFSEKSSYEEKVCCLQDEIEPTTVCSNTPSSFPLVPLIIAVIAVSAVVVICKLTRGRRARTEKLKTQEFCENDITPMPPPTNPNAIPSAPPFNSK